MVKLSIKKGDEPQFLYETTVDTVVDEVLADVAAIYNGRLKVQRICSGKLNPLLFFCLHCERRAFRFLDLPLCVCPSIQFFLIL